jgi:hypothetical protein
LESTVFVTPAGNDPAIIQIEVPRRTTIFLVIYDSAPEIRARIDKPNRVPNAELKVQLNPNHYKYIMHRQAERPRYPRLPNHIDQLFYFQPIHLHLT